MKSSERKQILTFSIYIMLLAQLNVDIFSSNFLVSLGILLFPILIFLYQKIRIVPITLLAGAGVYLSRVFVQSLRFGFTVQIFGDFYPELIFYYIYGGLFFLYFRRREYKLTRDCYMALFLIQYEST